jgi:hypothetical protein
MVPQSRISEAAEKMMTDGFYGLFDQDSDLVRGLAAIGTQADFFVTSDKVEADFSEMGLEYEPVLRALRRHASDYKVFTISDTDGMLHRSL